MQKINPTEKKVVYNTAVQIIGRVTSASLSLLSTLLIIRLAGAEVYGNYIKILALLAFGYAALDFGINAYIIRSLADSDEHEQRRLLTSTLYLRLFMALIAALVVNLVSYLLGGAYSPEIRFVLFLASASLFFHAVILTANIVFQHTLRYQYSVIASLSGSTLSIVFLWLSLRFWPNLAAITVSGGVVPFLIAGSLSVVFLLPWLTRSSSFKGSTSILKNSLVLGLALILSTVANKSDVLVLGFFRSAAEVGEYGFAYKFLELALVVPTFTMNSVYPLIVRRTDGQSSVPLLRKTVLALLFIAFLGAFVLFFVSPLIHLVKPGFFIAENSLRILSLSLPLFYLSAPLMWQLVAKNQEKTLVMIYLVASIVNVFSNVLSVPRLGATGSALSTIITEAVILLGLYYVNKRRRYL